MAGPLNPGTPRAALPLRAVFLLLFSLAACQDRESDVEPRTNGVVVRNPERGSWTPAQAWELVPEVTIGSADGEPEHVFNHIVDIAIDPLGRIWIADATYNEIRVFDERGTHVRTIGRKGAGPAEFTGIAGMDWDPGGRLWVLDGGNARFSVYDTTGQVIGTHRRDALVTESPWPGGFDEEGHLYDTGAVREDGGTPGSIVRFGPELQPLDTLSLPAYVPEFFEIVREDGRSRQVTRVNVPFSGMQIWQVDRQGFVWVAFTRQYRLERYAFDGTIDRIVERARRPLPVTSGERERFLENYRKFERQGGRLDLSRIPKTHPHFESFFFDEAGHLWVTPTTRGNEQIFDVFTSDGRYLGTVRAPRRLAISPLPVIRDSRMAAVTRDSLGVPAVAVLRVVKPTH